MASFMIRFLICNICISVIIGIFLAAKRIFKNNLSSRMQYNLWFILLGLLTVPFMPIHPVGIFQVFSLLGIFHDYNLLQTETVYNAAVNPAPSGTAVWINDFTLSVSRETPSIAGKILCAIWLVGVLAMIVLFFKSFLRLITLKKSALPLQNPEVRKLYDKCLNEMNISEDIPIYSTAFLKSPIMVGVLKPCIYLPIHLISEYRASDMRYMLLHELQHYRHKDAIAGYLMNLAGIIYWFNPAVWAALKEMRSDREVACDTSVLKMLNEKDYEDYGNTLINFAEKISLTPFPFAAGLGGNMKQIQRRILNIAYYQKPTIWKQIRGLTAFCMIAVLLLSVTPILSTYAAEANLYKWNTSDEKISQIDLSAYFEGYKGSFVLYDSNADDWNIYDMEQATTRVSPNSTYKIYDSLFALEEGIITPEDSFIAWNKTKYPFEAWNTDQTLPSAMTSSVNWYFQTLDEQLGKSGLQSYIQKIGYGNKNISGELSSYWLESTLKISPVEQVELLTAMYHNRFGFAPENIQTVKNSIRLSAAPSETIYGKSGTGRVNGQDINGWFIGYVEKSDNVYYFATNIQGESGATGSNAADITMSVLSDLRIWN